jgi:hypothetical protein
MVEAVGRGRAIMQERLLGHSDQSSSLNNLAILLYARYEQRGVLSDLDEAIDLDRAALALCPPGHSNRSDSLDNLASLCETDLSLGGI